MGNAEKWCKNHSPGLGVGAAGKRVRGASQRRRGGEEARRRGEERLPGQLQTALLSHSAALCTIDPQRLVTLLPLWSKYTPRDEF
ncbi:hypothetical protein EYF80_013246 [Liparis tanakae]|uniref:Uncharacterized protein n=1 Tax=Liparis tanakae TaxID=230148 RepID=A0A4Z2IF69_9TELE|nr:hypothetical protein EYF80_013246 [Liparis tanakae]